MKSSIKLLALVLFITCFTHFFSSCSNEEIPMNEAEKPEILIQLKNFNDSISSSAIQSRISGTNKLIVAASDALGAYSGCRMGGFVGSLFGPVGSGVGGVLGAIIGGAGTSRRVYLMAQNMENMAALDPLPILPNPGFNPDPSVDLVTRKMIFSGTLIKPEDYMLGLQVGIDSSIVEIGIQHNYILELLKDETSDDEYIGDIKPELSGVEREIIESADFENGYNEVLMNASNLNFEINTTADEIMDLFISAVYDKEYNERDLNVLVKYYTDKVKRSNELNEDEKNALIGSFSVYLYSINYWNINFN